MLKTKPKKQLATDLRRIIEVTPKPDFHLDLTYADGSHSVVDFSSKIERGGVFARLEDPEFFSKVTIGEDGRTLEWPGELDFCADSLWLDGNP